MKPGEEAEEEEAETAWFKNPRLKKTMEFNNMFNDMLLDEKRLAILVYVEAKNCCSVEEIFLRIFSR